MYSPRVPFEMRSRFYYWNQRRSWPPGGPVTFTQKVVRKMALDRRPLLTTFADKVAVRDYVAGAVGSEVLPRLHAVVADPAELELSVLPAEFVVKPSHASGMIWIVGDRAHAPGLDSGESARLSGGIFTTTRRGLDRDQLVATCRTWLKIRYADVELEWAYRDVPPRIMVEELLLGRDGHIPPDYKLYVFDGRVRLVQVNSDRFTSHRVNLFRPDWTPVDASVVYPPAEPAPARPDSLDEMVHIAETLGKETDFVRVDLYDVDGRIVFGELTSNPGGGRQAFSPESFDVELGGYWNAPQHYR